MQDPTALTPEEFKKKYGYVPTQENFSNLELTPEQFVSRYGYVPFGVGADSMQSQPKPDDSPSATLRRMAAGPINLLANVPTGLQATFDLMGRPVNRLVGQFDPEFAAELERKDEAGRETAKRIRETAKRFTEETLGAKPGTPVTFENLSKQDALGKAYMLARGTAETIPSTLTLLGLRFLNAPVALATTFLSETGQTEANFQELEKEGVEIDPAYRGVAVVGAGALKAALEKFGLDNLAKISKVPGAKGKILKVFASSISEGGTEGVQELTDIVSETGAKISKQDAQKAIATFREELKKAIPRLEESTILGTLSGGTIGGGVDVAVDIASKRARSKTQQEILESIAAKYGAKSFESLPQNTKEAIITELQQAQKKSTEQREDNATREQVAQQAFGKKFDDLTDEQKQKIVDKAAEAKTAEEDARIDETLQGVEAQTEPLEEISQKVYGQPYAELPLAQRQALKKRYQTLAEKAQAKKVDDAIAEKVGLKKPKVEKPARKEAQPPAVETPPTEKAAAVPVAPKPSVKVMITKADEKSLRDKGYSQEEIDKFTPQQAQEILSSPSQSTVAPSPVSARAGEETQPSKTDVVEKPIAEIATDVDRFQNRATDFSEKTAATVAERFDLNLFDPIVLWKDPKNGKEYVLSGHSRLEGMKRRGAKNIPSRYFQGTEAEAMNFAKVEANRLGSAENLQETIKAYKQAKRGNATKSKLKDLFDGDVEFLESAQNLNESGDFIRYLGQGAATEFPYIKRFSRWVGELRKTHGGKLTDRHEQQVFDWLYKGEKHNREIEKDRFFELVEKQVSRTDFNPNAPLQLKRGEAPKIGTRGRADTAKLEGELDQLRTDKKNARTSSEAQAIDKEIARVESAIKTLVKTQPDLFGEAETRPAPKESTTPTHKEFDTAFETFQEVAAKQTGKTVPEQSAAIAEELRARNVNPVIIDELTSPRRALKPRNPESERSATSRPERIARAVEPHELKPKVDAIAQANVDFRNKEAALLKAREEIKAEIEARGGEVVVDTDTGAMTITLKPGRAKISETDQALIERLRAEAAEAGAYSLATVGQGFEISSTPERIADAESLPAGDFKARALEFLRRNAEAKAAEKVFKQAKEDARNDLVDYYLAERVAGKETPPALLGRAKDGTKVEVMARRVRSAAEPDLAIGGRDFPKEIAEAKQKAQKKAGEPFIEARKTGNEKIKQAKERGAFVAEQSEGYQPNRPGDFLFNPDAVFEQKPYEPNYKKRPDATPRTDRLAKEFVDDLGKNRKRGRVYLANAIDASARETGQISLVEQEIKTTDDLAVVGQVARDPRVEHLRYVLVKDGKSIGSYMVGSRLPSATAAFPYASTKEGIEWLNGLMEETGADGYFMLHNHPSGEVDTSGKEDIKVTETVSKGVKGFKGHVIIDSNVYATITREKDGSLKKQVKQKFFGEDKLLVPSLDHRLIGRKAEDANDLMAIGKSVQSPEGWATIVGATPDSRIRGIAEVEEALLQTKGKRRAAVIRKFARDTGSANVFLVADQKFFDANKDTLMKAVELGFITDAVSSNGDSIISQFPKLRKENVFFGKEIEAGRLVKEGATGKKAWEFNFDELVEHQKNFNQEKITSAERELKQIETEARKQPIQGNLTRRKDFSDLKQSKGFSEKFGERYRLASDTITKYEALLKGFDDAETMQRVRDFHKSAVEKAVSKGYPVSERVLSEYRGETNPAKVSEKEKRLSRLLPPEDSESAAVTSAKKMSLRGKHLFEKTPPAGWSESDLVQSTKGAQGIPDTITGKEEPSIVRESEGTYGKAELNRDQFLDLGKMVNDFLQNKDQVAKLSKAEREEFALILDVLKDYKELSEKAELSPSEKVLLKYAIRDIESPEGKRVIEKVQAALRENKTPEPSLLDKVAEWTASMYLWRLASVGSSLGSNLFRQLLKYPELKLAAWFNQGVARQTRVERTRFSEEAEKDFRDAWTGEEFKKAARKALDIMQEKPDAAEESKFFEREKVKRKSIGGKKGTVIRAGLNAQAAIDVLFRQPATTAAISRYSFREAAKTSKNRVEQAKKANSIAQNVRRLKALKDAKQDVPEYLEKFEPILAKAEADAEAQTFQSELDGWQKHVSELRRYPLARIFVPFFNTRMNVLNQAYDRTILSAFGKEFRDLGEKALNKKLTAEEAGRLSDRMAEITLGTAAFLVTTAALYGLSDDDEELITGDFDEKTIGEKPAGWLPNAVRVGDTYISMKGFEPYATIFTAFGNAASGKKSTARNAAEALAKAAFSNPMTDELFDIMGSLKDGDADKFFVDMVAGAATPGLLQDISKIVDPTIRKKEGMEDRFKGRVGIPGLSTTHPERIDVFGEDLEPQTSGEKALKAITGVSISKSKEDPARREIRKLGLKHNLNTITHQGVQLEPWEVLALNKSIGDEYHKTVLKLLQNPTYLAADKEARKAKLRAVRKGLIDRQKAILERTPYFMARERVAGAQKESRERVKEQLE